MELWTIFILWDGPPENMVSGPSAAVSEHFLFQALWLKEGSVFCVLSWLLQMVN